MEVLVSASIFAMVMVIATGVLGTSSQMRTKIDEVKLNSEEGSKLAELISDDVRSANVSGTVKAKTTEVMTSGIALLYCSNVNFNNCTFINDDTIDLPNGGLDGLSASFGANNKNGANMLVVFNKTEIKVIYAGKSAGKDVVYYKTFSNTDSTIDLNAKSSDIVGSQLHSTKVDEMLVMTGFAPKAGAVTKQQPYVRFFIQTKTKGAAAGKENTFELRSWVTSRNYQ